MGALCLQTEQSGGGVGGCLIEREMAFLTLEVRSTGVVVGEEEEEEEDSGLMAFLLACVFLVLSLKLLRPLSWALDLVGLSRSFHFLGESVDLLAGMGALGGFSNWFTPLVPVSFCSHQSHCSIDTQARKFPVRDFSRSTFRPGLISVEPII